MDDERIVQEKLDVEDDVDRRLLTLRGTIDYDELEWLEFEDDLPNFQPLRQKKGARIKTRAP